MNYIQSNALKKGFAAAGPRHWYGGTASSLILSPTRFGQAIILEESPVGMDSIAGWHEVMYDSSRVVSLEQFLGGFRVSSTLEPAWGAPWPELRQAILHRGLAGVVLNGRVVIYDENIIIRSRLLKREEYAER